SAAQMTCRPSWRRCSRRSTPVRCWYSSPNRALPLCFPRERAGTSAGMDGTTYSSGSKKRVRSWELRAARRTRNPGPRTRNRDMTERDFAVEVVRRLHDAGYQALWAGGCVRDELLGLTPKDYDVATSARPEEVRRLFRRTIAVGMSF